MEVVGPSNVGGQQDVERGDPHVGADEDPSVGADPVRNVGGADWVDRFVERWNQVIIF